MGGGRRLRRAAPALSVAASLLLWGTGCGIPRDPEGTLERVREATMHVGVAPAHPFTQVTGDEPSGGIEVELIEDFAASLDADIEWVTGSEEELLSALEVRALDLVIGGFTSTNPWSSKVTFTHPYATTFATVGVPDPNDVDTDLTGLEVAVERGSELAGLLTKTDMRPVVVDDIATATGPAAVEDWMLDDLGLYATDVRLKESDHVMAVPLGENAWITELEEFLLAHDDEITRLIEEATP